MNNLYLYIGARTLIYILSKTKFNNLIPKKKRSQLLLDGF